MLECGESYVHGFGYSYIDIYIYLIVCLKSQQCNNISRFTLIDLLYKI